jgi:hypothetical protein
MCLDIFEYIYIYAAHLNRFDSCQDSIEDYISAELVIYLVFVKCRTDGQEKMHYIPQNEDNPWHLSLIVFTRIMRHFATVR